MSVYFHNSKLIKNLKFNYSEESVIRFYSRKCDYFFAVHNLEAEKVVELINYLITHAKDQFYVSYFSYQAGMELFITHDKLQSKPYFFNCHTYSDSLTRSELNVFIPVRIPIVLLDSIESLANKLNATKGELISLAIINEFGQNPWMKSYEHDNVIDALENDAYTFSNYNGNDSAFEAVEIPNWQSFHKHLIAISGEEAANQDLISKFIVERKKRYRNKVEYMKDLGEYQNMRYVIKAYSRDGHLIRDDKLPLNFSLHKLEQLFTQNIDGYKHTYELHVYDPFIKNEFVYHPTLVGFLPESRAKSCNFSIPKTIFNWINVESAPSDRLRSGMFIQAIYNSVNGWEKKLTTENFPVVYENLTKFMNCFKQGR